MGRVLAYHMWGSGFHPNILLTPPPKKSFGVVEVYLRRFGIYQAGHQRVNRQKSRGCSFTYKIDFQLTLIIQDTEKRKKESSMGSFITCAFWSLFNWVPPTSTVTFILISVVEEQESTTWEESYIKSTAGVVGEGGSQNKILLENLRRSVQE